MGELADEAALLQGRNQSVDAGFGAQVQRLLHFLERRRNAGFLQPLVNEHEQFVLFAREHEENRL